MTGFLHEKEFSRKSFLKGSGALVVGFSLAGAGLLPATAKAASTVALACFTTRCKVASSIIALSMWIPLARNSV